MTDNSYITCPICHRLTLRQHQEKHHLVPKVKGGKETLLLCKCCGDMLHKLFTIKELEKKYNTLESIQGNADVKKWASWISKKPNDFSVCMATKKRR